MMKQLHVQVANNYKKSKISIIRIITKNKTSIIPIITKNKISMRMEMQTNQANFVFITTVSLA